MVKHRARGRTVCPLWGCPSRRAPGRAAGGAGLWGNLSPRNPRLHGRRCVPSAPRPQFGTGPPSSFVSGIRGVGGKDTDPSQRQGGPGCRRAWGGFVLLSRGSGSQKLRRAQPGFEGHGAGATAHPAVPPWHWHAAGAGGDPTSSAGSRPRPGAAEGPARRYRHRRAPLPARCVPGSGGCRIRAAQDHQGQRRLAVPVPPVSPPHHPWPPHCSLPSPRRGAGGSTPALITTLNRPSPGTPWLAPSEPPDCSGCPQDIVPTCGGAFFCLIPPLRPHSPCKGSLRWVLCPCVPDTGSTHSALCCPLGPPGPAPAPCQPSLGDTEPPRWSRCAGRARGHGAAPRHGDPWGCGAQGTGCWVWVRTLQAAARVAPAAPPSPSG